MFWCFMMEGLDWQILLPIISAWSRFKDFWEASDLYLLVYDWYFKFHMKRELVFIMLVEKEEAGGEGSMAIFH